jgi:hypothetical protein
VGGGKTNSLTNVLDIHPDREGKREKEDWICECEE